MSYKYLYILLLVSFFIISCEVGCNDDTACNYNELATVSDGSCLYEIDCAGECGGSALCNDTDAANAKVDEANKQLFDDLDYIFDQDAPEDFNDFDQYFDLRESHVLYSEALELDTANNGAFFGLAYSEILSFSQDQRLYNAYNEWTDCIDDLTEDDVAISGSDNGALSRSQFANQGFRFGMPISGKAFYAFNNIDIINFLPIITSHNDVMLYSNELCPEIESIQDLLENVFLSRISTAISHMENVVGEGFVFTLTPDMLGDEDQEKIELDDTVFYLMKALLHQLRAMMYMVITYNVNVPFYDFAKAEDGWVATDFDWQWLAQDADFLTIRSGQENSLPKAHADLNNVINSIESAWTFLKTDTETYYDIILEEDVTDIEEEMEDDLDSDIDEFLDEARKVLNEEYETTIEIGRSCISYTDETGYWHEECTSEEVDITLDIGDFLQAPPQNLKAIIPNYSIETRNCTYEDTEHRDGDYFLNIPFSNSLLENGNMYEINGNCYFDNSDNQVHVYLNNQGGLSGNDSAVMTMVSLSIKDACTEIISNYTTNMNVVEYFGMSFYTNVFANNNTLLIEDDCNWWLDYKVSGNWGAPIPSWEATSCDAWKSGWDVTIGGLFPNMTPTKFFDEIIELEEEDCEDEIFNIECEDF